MPDLEKPEEIKLEKDKVGSEDELEELDLTED